MNKVITLLLVSLLFYSVIKAVINFFVKIKSNKRKYQVTLLKQVNHLFSALLLIWIPLALIIRVYSVLPFTGKVIVLVAGGLCLLCAMVSFYLYYNHLSRTPYQSLTYDPQRLTLEFTDREGTLLITVNRISAVKWYRVKNIWKSLAWGSFQYLELQLRNGHTLVIPSLIIDPAELSRLLTEFEVIPVKKIIPRIR